MTDEQGSGQGTEQPPEQGPETRQQPWFRGFWLQGELAGLYELERAGEDDPQASPAAGAGQASPELVLEGLAPITILVGANNSGKSRLLRGIFADPGFVPYLQYADALGSRNHHVALSELIREVSRADRCSHDMTCLLDTPVQIRAEDGWIASQWLERLDQMKIELESLFENGMKYFRREPDQAELRRSDFQELEKKRVKQVESIKRWIYQCRSLREDCDHSFLSCTRYYIPVLRGMRPLTLSTPGDKTKGDDDKDAYMQRTCQDYFSTCDWLSIEEQPPLKQPIAAFAQRPRIFTGLGIYADMQRRLLSPSQDERDSIRAYEQFLSEQFFPGQPVTLTPALHRFDDQGQRIHNDVVYLKIGDSEDRPIYDLGDGMQSLIICTYPIITELNAGSLFFIEEPDLCMHPSLQRIFLSVLRQYHRTKGHQFFLTTHSNHLLDLLEDDPLVSIFSFSRVETVDPTPADQPTTPQPLPTPAQANDPTVDRFRIRPTSQWDRNILSQLGVRPSATYLANATIWVEGTSDGAYLRAYLDAFVAYLELRGDEAFQNVTRQLKRYKEDRHYAFVEYNGANLVHFNFDEAEASASGGTQASGTNAASLCAQALVIADGDIVGKADRVRVFARQLKHRFVVLPVKEIENLIPEQVLHRQLEADRGSKRDTEEWPKTYDQLLYKHYRVSRNVKGVKSGLGYILEKREFKGYKEKSGTLKGADKQRWACQDRGIPRHLSRLIQEYRDRRENNESQESPPRLPPYLNQDLVWLCVLIFAHIAKLNHDSEVFKELDAFKDWIGNKYVHAPPPDPQLLSPDQCNEKTHVSTPSLPTSGVGWPIPNPAAGDSRACLLSHYLEDRKQG